MNKYTPALVAALVALPLVTTFTTTQKSYHARVYSQPDPYSTWRIVDDDVDYTVPQQTSVFNYTIPGGAPGTLYTLTRLNYSWILFPVQFLRIYSEGELVWDTTWLSNDPALPVSLPILNASSLAWEETPLVLNGPNLRIELQAVGLFAAASFNQTLVLMGRRSTPWLEKLNVLVESEGPPHLVDK